MKKLAANKEVRNLLLVTLLDGPCLPAPSSEVVCMVVNAAYHYVDKTNKDPSLKYTLCFKAELSQLRKWHQILDTSEREDLPSIRALMETSTKKTLTSPQSLEAEVMGVESLVESRRGENLGKVAARCVKRETSFVSSIRRHSYPRADGNRRSVTGHVGSDDLSESSGQLSNRRPRLCEQEGTMDVEYVKISSATRRHGKIQSCTAAEASWERAASVPAEGVKNEAGAEVGEDEWTEEIQKSG